MSSKEKVLKLDDETRSRLERARQRAIGGRYRGSDRRIAQRWDARRIRVWRPGPHRPGGNAA